MDTDRIKFWFDDLIELKPGWFIRRVIGERFIGGLPVNPHDPITVLTVTAVAAGGVTAYSQYQQGQEAEKLAKKRSAIDLANAKMAEEAAAEKTKLEEERGQDLLQRQSVLFSASGVRSNVGAPLVIKAETQRRIALQKQAILTEGHNIADNYRMQAAYEKAYGKSQKKKARWDMWTTILMTGATAGMMGYNAGMFGAGTGAQSTAAVGWGNAPFIPIA